MQLPATWTEWDSGRKRHYRRESRTRLALYQSVANLAGFPPRESADQDVRLTRGELAWLVVVLTGQVDGADAGAGIKRHVAGSEASTSDPGGEA